ncbi:MAG: phage/plasmid replication protein [Gallionellaceae bacterium]
MGYFGLRLVTIWSQIMIDWVTAILPCNHSETIYGGRIACISPDGEIEWQVEKKKQVVGSYESNLNVKSQGSNIIYLDGNLSFPRFFVFQEVAFMLPAFLSAEL